MSLTYRQVVWIKKYCVVSRNTFIIQNLFGCSGAVYIYLYNSIKRLQHILKALKGHLYTASPLARDYMYFTSYCILFKSVYLYRNFDDNDDNAMMKYILIHIIVSKAIYVARVWELKRPLVYTSINWFFRFHYINITPYGLINHNTTSQFLIYFYKFAGSAGALGGHHCKNIYT